MSKIINFGITEDDINWREKDDYMVGDDKIDDEQCRNIMSGKEYGWGTSSGRGYGDGDSDDLIHGISYSTGYENGHNNYNCGIESGEGSGSGTGNYPGRKDGICLA